jgi:hypothetical protein
MVLPGKPPGDASHDHQFERRTAITYFPKSFLQYRLGIGAVFYMAAYDPVKRKGVLVV